jgi:uncharacterized OsmC-like protein
MSVMTRAASRLSQCQGELRARYRSHPAQAVICKRATTVWREAADPVHGTVMPGDGYGVVWDFGVDRAVGGAHDAPNPGEMLCAALAACQHATIRMVADVLGIVIEHLGVEVVGDVDVRGCLRIAGAARVGFSRFECRVDLVVAPDTDARLCAKLRAEAEHSCINFATLRGGVPVEHAWKANVAEAVEPQPARALIAQSATRRR